MVGRNVNSALTENLAAFSVAEGGPGTGVMKRLRMIRPEMGRGSLRTALILAVLTWLPLLLLSVVDGVAFGHVKMPFVRDLFAHVRFLFTVPVLVLAEIPIGDRTRAVIRHLIEAPLVSEKDLPRFERIVIDTMRMRDSRAAGLVILGLSYFLTYMVLSGLSFLGDSIWFRRGSGAGLTIAGYWYAFVSLPVYQFLIFRWVYRIVVWTRVMRKVAQLKLLLTPIHPDLAGGLGFLGKAMLPFGLILLGLSAAISGAIGSRVLFEGARFEDFQWSYLALIVLGLVVIAAPLLVFTPTLLRLKQQGLMEYASAASRHTQVFQRKVEQASAAEGALPDLSGIQSLQGLSNSFERIKKLRAIPIEPSDFIIMAFLAVVPGLPLLATVVDLENLARSLFKMVL
jgi:hypothetical protein